MHGHTILKYSMVSEISSTMKGIRSLWNVTSCSLLGTNVSEQPAGAVLYTEAEAAGEDQFVKMRVCTPWICVGNLQYSLTRS